MAITSGSYTVGSAGDYASWYAANVDIGATLTGDLTFTQISDTTEPTAASPAATVNLNGHTLTLQSNSPHQGDPTQGWVSTIGAAGTSNALFNVVANNGTMEVKDLRLRCTGSGTNLMRLLAVSDGSSTLNLEVHDCILEGNGATQSGNNVTGCSLGPNAATSVVEVWNCTFGYCNIGLEVTSGFSGPTIDVENCTAHDCVGAFSSAGLYFTSWAGTINVRNCASFDCGTDDFYHNPIAGAINGYNNASKDATAANGNWSVGSGNVTGIVPANEFESTSYSSSDYLRVKSGGSCEAGGTAPTIPSNTTGIRGNTRPHSGNYSIGADEYLALAPSVTSTSPSSGTTLGGTPVTVNGSDFVNGATITFGGNPATGVSFVDSGQIDCTTPAGSPGAVDVVVTNPDTQFGTLTDGYTYVPPPEISLSLATLAPSCVKGDNAVSDTFEVWTPIAGSTLSYDITDNVSWLACQPSSGSSTGERDAITVVYTTSGLDVGTYAATIVVTDAAATNSPQTISVILTVTAPTTTLEHMPNQARTLLLNRDGSTRPGTGFYGEEYVSGLFKAVSLPSELLAVRRALFGSNPDNAGMNYMLWHYMRLLHSTEYSEYVTALDSRVTYLTKRSLVDYEYGPSVTPDDDALEFAGESTLGGADGRLYASWRITYSASVEITNLQTGFSELNTPVITDGLTNFLPLTGMSSLLVRIRVPASAMTWVVEYLEQPTSELDPITRAEQIGSIGNAAYAALFPNRSPYTLFKELWEQHSEFPYKISGVLLALLYLTDEYRTTAV